VRAPDEELLNRAYQLFSDQVNGVEYLIGYEGNDFTLTGDIEQDLMGITAVHPMRKEAVNAFLARAGALWEIVDRLVARGDLVELEHDGHLFYLRKFSRDRETP